MFNIEWDQVSERLFETGTDRGVLYPFNKTTKAYDKGCLLYTSPSPRD